MPVTSKKQIIKSISEMSGKYAPYDIFSDWVEMMAIAIQNGVWLIQDSVWMEREKQFTQIRMKYTDKEFDQFREMYMLLCEALCHRMTDVLGEIYMESGCGNKHTGQFFTPFSVSQLMANAEMQTMKDESRIFSIYEPTVGSGGAVIAIAAELQDRGISYQQRMRVIAQDIDWKAVYMSYVQLSLLGIHAEVAQGDTLSEPYNGHNYPQGRVFSTPRAMGVML